MIHVPKSYKEILINLPKNCWYNQPISPKILKNVESASFFKARSGKIGEKANTSIADFFTLGLFVDFYLSPGGVIFQVLG